MGKRNGFNQKGKSDSLAAPATKKHFMAPMLGLGDVYFTWSTVINAARYAKVVKTLIEYVSVHFQDEVTAAARAMEKLKAPTFVKSKCPIRRLIRIRPLIQITNVILSTKDNVPKSEDWEHQLIVKE